MLTEFATIQVSRQELQEIHRALAQKAMVQDEIIRERGGTEQVERHELLERIEMLVGENEETLHMLDHATEDELWEYAWYSFTDEWAWFRAAQDIEKECQTSKVAFSATDMHTRIEHAYQKGFDMYIAEISMQDKVKKIPTKKSQPKTS